MRLLVIFFLLFPFYLFGQSFKKKDTNPDFLDSVEIKLSSRFSAPSEIKFPFSSVIVEDNRYDTSKLGFMPVYELFANKKRMFKKITIQNGLSWSVTKLYNEYYANSFSANNFKLLMVVKRLWFSHVEDESDKELDLYGAVEGLLNLHCKVEYYFLKDSVCIPFKRLDTVFNKILVKEHPTNNILRNNLKYFFRMFISSLLETIDFNTAFNKISEYPQKTPQQLKDYNTAYFNIPVIKDTGIAYGVFMNFKEFRENKPSIKEFSEKKIKIGLNNYENYLVDKSGNRIMSYWGYKSANDFKIGKFYNEIIYRKGKTFEFFAKTFSSGQLSPSFTEGGIWIPYQLDMETGNIY